MRIEGNYGRGNMESERISALSMLININNERAKGYHLAAAEAHGREFQRLFMQLGDQSSAFMQELTACMESSGLPGIAKENHISKLSGMWMDLRVAALENNGLEELRACEGIEDVTKQTYDEVMEFTEDLTAQIYELISNQNTELHRTQEVLRSMSAHVKH